MKKTIPSVVSDVLLHLKVNDNEEKVLLPYTRYDNVLNAPKVISNANDNLGAPFTFFCIDEVELTTEELRETCGNII